jgi:transcriptional regulator with XRE-family HTH domain
MHHISTISARLKQQAKAQNATIVQLQRQTGLSALTISAALSGTKDSQISTLLAIAKELGLSFVLLPTSAAQLMEQQAFNSKMDEVAPSWVDASMDALPKGEA